MEKRTCKLCFKTFVNGRALGGHMRSHMLKLQAHPSPPPPPPPAPPSPPAHLYHQLEYDTDSAYYAYSSEEEGKGLSYGLRENPRKSFRLVDPEFASFGVVDAGSVVQDRESETESSRNPSRRRSKRSRKSGVIELPSHLQNYESYRIKKKASSSRPIGVGGELVFEQEPVSSVSDTTPDEDVAWCLMMLSRGIRSGKGKEVEEDDEDDEQEQDQDEENLIEESEDEMEEIKIQVKRSRAKFQCGTCKKFFRSYQALGGHRASHKKIKSCNNTTPSSSSAACYEKGFNVASPILPPTSTDPKIHECPVCFRVFSSGQALGGHKRSHLTGSSPIQQPIRINNAANANANANSARLGNNLIDLNLPAPMDDEDQFELSAVSDGPNRFA